MKVLDDVSNIIAELKRAERKFPGFPTDPVHAAAIVVEEAGELQQAALQFTYEGGSFGAMYAEAMQTGAMALRFMMNIHAMRKRTSELVERRKTVANTTKPKSSGGKARGRSRTSAVA